jgi:copper(I)-binding protein
MSGMHGSRYAGLVALVALLIGAAAFVTGQALAGDYSVGTLRIDNPWTRATPKGASVAGGYLRIINGGTASDRLVGGSSEVAARFEIHSTVMDRGVAKMRPVEGGLEIKPGQTVEFKPGSFHIMLMGLKRPLEKGQKVKGTLEFEKAGKVDIEYAVEALGSTSPASTHGH